MKQNDIPAFLDYKRSVASNPYVEMLCSALEIVEKGYPYDTMFRYLRTGLTGISRHRYAGKLLSGGRYPRQPCMAWTVEKENEKKHVPAGTGNVKCPAGADYGAVFESGSGFKG